MLKDFRAFILRGNVLDLAVAVVVGAAFGAVVTALVTNVITPLIAIPGTVDFSKLQVTISDSHIRYGLFLNALIAFLLIAAAVFFLIVRPVNKLMERYKTEPEVESPTKQCAECLSNIPSPAKRCAFCGQPQAVTTS
ncbi:MAG: large conductance mechanosensitive channel protein MscL [Actinomycetota bacterium]|nr:large conductance mechanosensitive channel protein MscL [Actinomycetota bacterium]